MFYVYILHSESSGHYYIGQTQDLKKRIHRHNTNQSKYTKNKGPWKLVYFEAYLLRTEAIKRETKIKKMKSRKYIENLISSSGCMHPDAIGT
jgi:putative endonuclease